MHGNSAQSLRQLICVNALLGNSAPAVPTPDGLAPDALVPMIYDEIEPDTDVCMQTLSAVLTLYTGRPAAQKTIAPLFLAPENPSTI